MSKRRSRSIKANTPQQQTFDTQRKYENFKKSDEYKKYSNGEDNEAVKTTQELEALYDDLISVRDHYYSKIQGFFDTNAKECLDHLVYTDQNLPLHISTKEQWKLIRDSNTSSFGSKINRSISLPMTY